MNLNIVIDMFFYTNIKTWNMYVNTRNKTVFNKSCSFKPVLQNLQLRNIYS